LAGSDHGGVDIGTAAVNGGDHAPRFIGQGDFEFDPV
jgi:hypothetical protein